MLVCNLENNCYVNVEKQSSDASMFLGYFTVQHKAY